MWGAPAGDILPAVLDGASWVPGLLPGLGQCCQLAPAGGEAVAGVKGSSVCLCASPPVFREAPEKGDILPAPCSKSCTVVWLGSEQAVTARDTS